MDSKGRLYKIALKTICEQKEGRKLTNPEFERERMKIERGEDEKLYWRCIKGIKTCHEGRCWCSWACRVRFRHRNEFLYPEGTREMVSKMDFPLCLAGFNICHDGLLLCGVCRKANVAQNKPLWRCNECDVAFLTYRQCVQHEYDKHGITESHFINNYLLEGDRDRRFDRSVWEAIVRRGANGGS